MRTTLDIDENVLLAAKAIASQHGVSTGKIVSDLARRGLIQREPRASRNGVPLLPVRPGGAMVTLELVNALRDEA